MKKNYYQAIHQIITTGHWITDQISKELKVLDMTERQFNVMRILKDTAENTATVQEIQNNMVQKSSNVTRIVDRLIKKGFVNREECKTNRRKMEISLTEKGEQLLLKMEEIVASWHKPLEKKLNENELETLIKLIKRMKQNA